MNKLKLLQKALVKKLIIALLVIGASAGVYFFLDDLSDGYVQQKTDGEADLAKTTGERDQLKAKIEGAQQSEKNYVALLLAHKNPSFEAKKDALMDFFNTAKTHRRLSNLKVALSPETAVKDTALTSPDYEVSVRDTVKLEFDAIADVHVFALIADLMDSAPGFVRVKSVSLERKGDLTPEALMQLSSGALVNGVSAKIVVGWAGVHPKEATAAPDSKDATNAVPKTGAAH